MNRRDRSIHPDPWLYSACQDLSDQAAVEILDFLYELTTAFENRYYAQLRRAETDNAPHIPRKSSPDSREMPEE